MSIQAVYLLEPILDNPKYEGFGMGMQASLIGRSDRYEDFNLKYDAKVGDWVVPHLAAVWEPLHVLGRVRPFNDFPCVGLTIPAFSLRAVDVLRDVLEPNGELLPLVTSVGSYYIYNCTKVADIIDFNRSKLNYLNKSTILEIDHLQLHQNWLTGLSVFQMRKYHSRCCVTDLVARRIRQAKLEGFELRKLWPLPDGVKWWMHSKLSECHDELTVQPMAETRPIKGNSVVLRLALHAEEPSPQENAQFEEIADQLDYMLVNPRKNAKYLGNLEIMEFVPGEARYFFSCPDADELAKKLKPWLKALDWPGNKWLLKRYGEFVDIEATEESINI